jgi:hypothetical protein
MSEYCNQDLATLGKPYPRTCSICGIGTCHKYGGTNPDQSSATSGMVAPVSANMKPVLEHRILSRIEQLESDPCLKQKAANIQVNLFLCMRQIDIMSRLSELYALIGQTRPQYRCDDES